MEIVKDYYVNGTDFEIINCPCYVEGRCFRPREDKLINCKDNKDCIIKNHMVALSALIDIAKRNPRSAEHIGAMACFNSFIIKK